MKRMLVGAVAALAVVLAGSAWAQSQVEPPPATEASQTQSSDPAMVDPATTADPYAESSSLPATASPLPLVAVAGLIAIAVGARMSRRRG